MTRRLRPCNCCVRGADRAAAESAIIEYGNALRDLAARKVFPGDLLLKNSGVTNHGRVIFYDYDEICLASDCVFRDLPQPSCEEEETRARHWFPPPRSSAAAGREIRSRMPGRSRRSRRRSLGRDW